MRAWGAVLVITVVACGDDALIPDAGVQDASGDATADAMLDAPPDGPLEVGRRISGMALGVRGPSFVVLETPVSRQLVLITEDGPFAFPHLVADQAAITLSTVAFSPQTATCQVTPATATINGADLTTVAVGCDGLNELASIAYSPGLLVDHPFDRERLAYVTKRPFLVEATDTLQVTATASYANAGITFVTAAANVAGSSGQPSTIEYGTGWTVRLDHLARSRNYNVSSTPSVLAQEAYVKNPSPVPSEVFSRVAISQDTLVVGAPMPGNIGSVHVFVVTRSIIGAAIVPMWTHQAVLVPAIATTTRLDDRFGEAVAIDGDTIVVGAPFEDSSSQTTPDEASASSGAVYVFTRTGTVWSEQAYVKATNIGAGDNFGGAVAISGDTIAVGAIGEDGSSRVINGPRTETAAAAGAAYVFTRSGTSWSEQAYVKSSNADAGDTFGCAVSLSADTLAVGAFQERSNATNVGGNATDNSAINAGAAYVFTRSGTTWTQQAYVKASNTDAGDEFGRALSVDGDLLVVGAEGEDSSGVETSNTLSNAGAAYVYRRAGTVWTTDGYIKATRIAQDTNFGASVGIDRNHLIVGARSEGGGGTGVDPPPSGAAFAAGAAFLYRRDAATPPWTPMSLPYIKASNTQALDQFGTYVAIDGLTFAVGAPNEDSGSATGANEAASNAGAVYVYR